MNDVNTVNNIDSHQRKSSNFGKLPYILALSTILSVANPVEMKANNITDESLQNVEVVQNSDIVSNIQRRTGVTLPSMYIQKFRNFVLNSKILSDKDAKKFTEDFIVKQMQSSRGISKQNQLLFVWDAVYEQITSKNIYTGEDGNSGRLADFENVMDRVEQCGKNYNSGFKAYMRQMAADADRRAADADRDFNNSRQENIRLTNKGLNQLIEFYNLYRRNPSSIKQDEIRQTKEYAKHVIQNCKQYNINYKAKLSPEVRRFYGID